jgi:glucose/arabinose dehydrogenase
LVNSYTHSGVFQLAKINEDEFYAIERNKGDLFLFRFDGKKYKRISLGNVFAQYNISNKNYVKENKLNTNIDPVKGKLVGDDGIYATAFDLHFAFNKLFLSVTLPGQEHSCASLNLMELILNKNLRLASKKMILSTPCMINDNPLMWAGRITNSTKSLFLSVGEQRYDPSGFPKTDELSKSEIAKKDSIFGKVVKFSSDFLKFKIYSSGHRNAQGLFYSEDEGVLYESEHGPFGGDEVNILIQGHDYGWPFRTFGKPYPLFNTGKIKDEMRSYNPSKGIDKLLSKFGAISGSHIGFSSPIFSWIPGVGAGNILRVQKKSHFKDWRGDLIVSLMQDKSLHRLKLDKGSVILDERIQLGVRIRDFILTDSGFLIMATDEGQLLFYRTSGV